MLYFGRLLCGAGFGLVSSPAGVGTYLSAVEFFKKNWAMGSDWRRLILGSVHGSYC